MKLILKQSIGQTEYVNSGVVEKLYQLAYTDGITSSTLSNDSVVEGSISVPGTYQEYIDYLESFNSRQLDPWDIHISATKIYIKFADDAVKSALMSVYGDGVGITSSDVNTTYLNKSFNNNTSIHTFDELSQFTGVNYLTDQQFNGCTNLTSIDTSRISKVGNNCITNTKITHLDLSSLTTISGPNAFTGNTLLTSVDFGQNSSLIALGSTTFGGCTSLQTITIPTTITTIPNYCFYNDSNLTTISGTSNVTSIGGAAFENCSKLTTIDISSVTALAWNSFKGCSKLNNITLNSGLTSIPSNCFNGCSTLSSIDLSNVTSIGANAFEGCTSLSSIGQLNSNITSIPKGCFKYCTSLTSIDLSNITQIGLQGKNDDNYNNGAFQGCTSLTTVIGLSDIDYIGGWSFTNCTSLGTNQDLVINTTQTFIGAAAFYKTKYRSVVVNGPNVDSFLNGYYRPFENMPNCTYFDISNTVATRGTGEVIPNKTNLETVILPSTFSYLNYSIWAFSNNTVIKYFIILATTPPSYENTTYCKLGTNGNFYVPDNAVSTYKSTWPQTGNNGWNIHDHILPLSSLPVGVWKTGLYQQYEPYLSNSSNPAYSTT